MQERGPGSSERCVDTLPGGEQAVLERLSEDDRSALVELSRDPRAGRIPKNAALRLLRLGLAELLCGRLVPTVGGRKVAASIAQRL